MRPEPNVRIEQYRRPHPMSNYGGEPGKNWGFFVVGPLRIISSGTPQPSDSDQGWEHVSVSCADRCPTWDEMAHVKQMFWGSEELVLQFHPPREQHVNAHEFCLHLWKPLNQTITLPPRELLA